jgi:integrase
MRVRLKGINRVPKRLATGELIYYYYAWKGGPRLEGEPGSPQFIASYHSAHETVKREPKKEFRSVIDLYQDSPVFFNLSEKTKIDYRRYIAMIDKEFGDLPISAFGNRTIRREFLAWRDNSAKKTPRQADTVFAVLRRIVSWAFDQCLLLGNPCTRPGRVHTGSRRDIIWTTEQETAFYEKAPQQLHLALTMGLWTGQRKGDLVRLTWSAYDGSYLRLQQQKTKKRVSIPVARVLRDALNAARASQEELAKQNGGRPSDRILVSSKGVGWSLGGFDASWKAALKQAGITGVTFHDLRGTAVTRLAVAGCTVPEIATITGHSLADVEDILDRHYLNRDSGLGENAIRKLEASVDLPTERPTAD